MINLMSPINSLGYGVVGRNLLRECLNLDPQSVALFPIGQPQFENQEDVDCFKRGVENAKFWDVGETCVKVWHQHDMAAYVGSHMIGFPIFELDKFTDQEIHSLWTCDKLFVCSEWAKKIVLSHDRLNRKNVQVVPLGVDRRIFTPVNADALNASPTFNFINIGKCEIRKGHDILPFAFQKAFPTEKDVRLTVNLANPFFSEKEMNDIIQFYKRDQRINVITDRLPTQAHLNQLIQQHHCAVFPARAEGWNLDALECLACGLDLIITNYSAHTEFCNIDNSFLIEIDEVEPAYDGKWFYGQGNWAKMDLTQTNRLVKCMRQVYEEWKSHGFIINEAGIETGKQFSWKNSAEKLMKFV